MRRYKEPPIWGTPPRSGGLPPRGTPHGGKYGKGKGVSRGAVKWSGSGRDLVWRTSEWYCASKYFDIRGYVGSLIGGITRRAKE